jgi:hypothetical protein
MAKQMAGHVNWGTTAIDEFVRHLEETRDLEVAGP